MFVFNLEESLKDAMKRIDSEIRNEGIPFSDYLKIVKNVMAKTSTEKRLGEEVVKICLKVNKNHLSPGQSEVKMVYLVVKEGEQQKIYIDYYEFNQESGWTLFDTRNGDYNSIFLEDDVIYMKKK